MGGTSKFFSALSNLYHFYSLYSARKYVEQFSNGITIIGIYLNPLPGANAPPIEHSIFQVMKEASLLYCLPDNPFFYASGDMNAHAVQEATYACTSHSIHDGVRVLIWFSRLRMDLRTTLLQPTGSGILGTQEPVGRVEPVAC